MAEGRWSGELLLPPEPAVRRTLTNPESVVALREKSSRPRDARGSPPVAPRSVGSAGDRKFTMRCYSTDTALDYNQGICSNAGLDASLAGSRDGAYCRRSASLQQHSTIGPGTYKKLEGGVGLVRGGIVGGSGGASGLVPRKRPPMVRQRVKVQNNPPDLHYSSVSVPTPDPDPDPPASPVVPLALPDGEDTQCAPTWNTYLYQLQLQAPQPICVPPTHEIPNRPPQYDPKE
ncbi:hypothetical protein ElyMa_004257700 [Elysia marginata]|uniref:Uncharacterized protein n=1 Tax=Elysia marginata TaxID=1093978 RepID=A0AAV4GTJ6_9GAST|nr:hypothetical protein ElyMa_004257700 [Elysia marginata]